MVCNSLVHWHGTEELHVFFFCMVGIVAAQMQEICCFIVFHIYCAENKSPGSTLNATLNAIYYSNVASLFFHQKGRISHLTRYGNHGTEAREASVVHLLICRRVIPQCFCTLSTSPNIVFQELFSVETVPEIEVESHLGRCSNIRMRTYPEQLLIFER
jgi:hypothetical protein